MSTHPKLLKERDWGCKAKPQNLGKAEIKVAGAAWMPVLTVCAFWYSL